MPLLLTLDMREDANATGENAVIITIPSDVEGGPDRTIEMVVRHKRNHQGSVNNQLVQTVWTAPKEVSLMRKEVLLRRAKGG